MGLSGVQPVYRDFNDASSLDASAIASLACDVSFISDASTPDETMVARQVERLKNPKFTALWWDIFDRLRSDEFVPHRARVMTHVHDALRDASIEIDDNWLDAIFRFFDQLNEAMFQQQTIDWLADSTIKLYLYGAGWESHPTLSRFARGQVDSESMRIAVARASRINLAAGVYGALSPHVTEVIGAGGFAMMRFTPVDLLERFYPPIWEFCGRNQIDTNAQLAERATATIRNLLDFAGRTIGVHPLHAWEDFVSELRAAAESGYTRSAAAVFANYAAVSFSSKDQLLGMVERYLYDGPQRQRLADEMRREVRARFDHVQVNRPARATVAA
jgi:hypothetical protein